MGGDATTPPHERRRDDLIARLAEMFAEAVATGNLRAAELAIEAALRVMAARSKEDQPRPG